MTRSRVLALDYGRVHCGAAISDLTATIVRPLEAVKDAGAPEGLGKIAALVEANDAGMVIVGMPVSLSGEAGAQAAETVSFIAALQTVLSVAVIPWDERFTSKLASRKGRHSGSNPHSLAACCLLEDYLGSAQYRRISGGN